MTDGNDDLIELESARSFDETIARLTEIIEAAGMSVFASIDHAGAARAIGMSMPPTTVLIYGNPRGGTPIMREVPLAALDLPLRVLVRVRADGIVTLAYRPVAALLRRASVSNKAAARLEPAQQILSRAAMA